MTEVRHLREQPAAKFGFDLKRISADAWDHPYSRETAAFPDRHTRLSKFWPSVGRVDNVYGDRNLVCSCVGMEAYAESAQT